MAESGRQDYDRLIRFTQLEPGEPFFFIRGRDLVAGPAVRAWAALASKAGAPGASVESALQHADRLDAWPHKQLPDADHLAPTERQALEYQLQRRAWNHRISRAPNETTLLAEARGAQAALSQVRHADTLLLDLVEKLAPVLGKKASAEATSDAMRALERVREDLYRRRSPGEALDFAHVANAPLEPSEADNG